MANKLISGKATAVGAGAMSEELVPFDEPTYNREITADTIGYSRPTFIRGWPLPYQRQKVLTNIVMHDDGSATITQHGFDARWDWSSMALDVLINLSLLSNAMLLTELLVRKLRGPADPQGDPHAGQSQEPVDA